MADWIANADSSPALFNIMLVTLAAMPPALLVAYTRQFLLTRRVRPEFSLRKSEAAELDRALHLYRGARSGLSQLNERSHETNALWQVIFALPAQIDQDVAEEREDLEAHMHHLRATIVRLRRLPLQRLRAWIHVFSLRSALGRVLAIHVAMFALLAPALHGPGPLTAAGVAKWISPVWFPSDQGVLQANAGAVCLAFILLPGFYLFRRATLGRKFGLEYCVLKELAASPPDQEADRATPQIDAPAAHDASDCWFSILGVPQSASVEQVRDAYKALIKGSHPDRVHDLSPAIRSFAEAETKRINAAYEQALASLT